MTLRELVLIFGTKAEVARQCGLTRQAVALWPMDEPVPELYRLKMKYEILPARMTGKKAS